MKCPDWEEMNWSIYEMTCTQLHYRHFLLRGSIGRFQSLLQEVKSDGGGGSCSVRTELSKLFNHPMITIPCYVCTYSYELYELSSGV